MGGGFYDHAATVAATQARAQLPEEKVFEQRDVHPSMNPRNIRFRECRDGENHPNSKGIIFALDQTGSMGLIPKRLAVEDLPHLMEVILGTGALTDPQILFMGVGDARNGEQGPIQMGQFESEGELMAQCLTRIFLEGQGGGNGGESYDLPFYMAARHTAMDCWEKRHEKGYLFVTGDEPHFERVEAALVRQYIGDEIDHDIPFAEIVKEANQTFHSFFLIPDLERAHRVAPHWYKDLGDHVISLEDPSDTSVAAGTLIGLTEGTLKDLEGAAKALKGLNKTGAQIARVLRAVEPYAAAVERGGDRRRSQNVGAPSPRSRRG